MLDASFIQKIEDLSPKVDTLEIDGFTYTTKPVYRKSLPTADTFTVHTLTAIIDYLGSLRDETSSKQELFIHVVSPGRIIIRSSLDELERDRESYVLAKLISDPFNFDSYMEVERFIIALQAQFVQDAKTAEILALVGNITHEASQTTLDDGVTQTVEAKAGIAKVENRMVPNPVILRPYRTFQEVEQPASKFVFRIKTSGNTPSCALFEADGGAWRNNAILSIKSFLEYEMAERNIKGVCVLA